MKPLEIGILGAGPAGLYAAILLKLANPEHRIRVIERNPAGATFGFGVVLSDKTLTHFREADPVSFDEITAHQATWKAIETYHRGKPVRCEGHYYLGIGRKRLLEILQKRCDALGVQIDFRQEVGDLTPFAGCDLVIAADGANSITRRTYAEHFQPSYEYGQAKYIWLGMEWVPSAFTFVFHTTEHGVFQAHIYPFDQNTSTCIVMCRDETWLAAGLDKLDEAASARFVKELLAPYVGDVRYLTNRSLWSTFNTIKAGRWSHGNVVLLGDAVHTAHWSIGSGTKLAMEDAIALVSALQRHEHIPTALQAYEAERKPIVEKLQQAGQVSQSYCENAERFMHLEPLQFAFQLMIRSRRLDYESLHRRDPRFMDAVDAWFTQRAFAAAGEVPVVGMTPAQSPVRLGGLVLRNRLVAASLPEAPSADGPGLILAAAADPATWAGLVASVHRRPGDRIALRLSGADPVAAAPQAAAAGFDMLHLPAASPEVVAAVRAAWPAGRPLAVALPVPEAGSLAETLDAARALKAGGCDLIHVAAATDQLARVAYCSEQIRNELRVATMVDCPGAGSSEVNTLIAGARADLCVLDSQ